ncbi:MAG TPA: FHA domain-containing protein [Solirubrobacteraceae bacterium]|jgi:predicted  nucleic acid-binding Zn-ribbon protein
MESLMSGTMAGAGSFRCKRCGYVLTLVASDVLLECPECLGRDFARASLFTTGSHARDSHASSDADDDGRWIAEARAQIDQDGNYLAYLDGDELKLFALTLEWTRIGRSLAADIRFDDPTVSRRHALVVRQADGVRVLDDRSLNGVFVNGERVEWRALRDGDEILVGRYRLRFFSFSESQTPSEENLQTA